MTTLTLILAVLLCAVLAVLLLDVLEQRRARRDRAVIRRLHMYLAKLPPARPW